MVILKIGDKVKTINGEVKIVALSRDGIGDEFIKFSDGKDELMESVYNFKKRLHKPLDKVTL